MSAMKKGNKSKFISKELVNELANDSQFLQKSPKARTQKRQRCEFETEDDDFSNLTVMYQPAKKKVIAGDESKESRQKLLIVMGHQLDARKQADNQLLQNLSEVHTQLEADYNALKDTEQKLEHLVTVILKCLQQTIAAQKQTVNSLMEISDNLKKEVEGLLTRGAMKADDRPLWFDVYRAFPPITEPKFARPKPEIKPLRPILYQEDILRAKFNSQGHGLVVNMLNPDGETQSKKLIKQYEKLKSEGVAENELVEKCVAAVGAERQLETPKANFIPKNPDSVSAQILADADLKNIFTEKEVK